MPFTHLPILATALPLSLGLTPAWSHPCEHCCGHRHGADDTAQRATLAEHTQQIIELPPENEAPPESFSVMLSIDGELRQLVLHRHSLREPNFRLILDHGDGKLVDAVPPAPRTYRGVVAGDPGTRVTASLRGDHFTASIHRVLADDSVGETWYVQPVERLKRDGVFEDLPSGPSVGPKAHVVYRRDAVSGNDTACANAQPPWQPEGEQGQGSQGGIAGAGAGVDGCFRATVALDADWEYYESHDESVDDVLDDLEQELNAVSYIYERDVRICYGIVAAIVRVNENDPYTSDDATIRPCQLRTWWNENADDISRNLVHMATGVDLSTPDGQGGTSYGTAGVAYANAVSCSPTLTWSTCPGYDWLHYSISEDMDVFAQQITLTAHEFGHNWGACHCDTTDCGGAPGNCGIMESSLSTPAEDWFSELSKAQIIEGRDFIASCMSSEVCSQGLYVPNDYPTIQSALGDVRGCHNIIYVESDVYATPTLALPWGGGITVIVPVGGTVYLAPTAN